MASSAAPKKPVAMKTTTGQTGQIDKTSERERERGGKQERDRDSKRASARHTHQQLEKRRITC